MPASLAPPALLRNGAEIPELDLSPAFEALARILPWLYVAIALCAAVLVAAEAASWYGAFRKRRGARREALEQEVPRFVRAARARRVGAQGKRREK